MSNLLRRSLRASPLLPSRSVALPVLNASESASQKLLRWLDITGFFSRYHSRKAWLLDLEPLDRIGALRTTEFERKFKLFRTGVSWAIWPVIIYLALGELSHLNGPVPLPVQLEFSYVNNTKTTNHITRPMAFYKRCSHCRPLEQDCKKECFDKLRAEGYSVYGLNHARIGHSSSFSTY
jgi:hypothetical protein